MKPASKISSHSHSYAMLRATDMLLAGLMDEDNFTFDCLLNWFCIIIQATFISKSTCQISIIILAFDSLKNLWGRLKAIWHYATSWSRRTKGRKNAKRKRSNPFFSTVTVFIIKTLKKTHTLGHPVYILATKVRKYLYFIYSLI